MAICSNLSSSSLSSQALSQHFWICNSQLNDEKIQIKIIKRIPMQEFLQNKGYIVHFNSQVFYVELSSDEKAVLKKVPPRQAVAEVAAYRACNFLEFSFVPPTKIYVENQTAASIQKYLEPSIDLAKDENYRWVLSHLSAEERANIDIFYFVFGQWDPDGSNGIAVKVSEKFHLFLIDNAAMGFEQKVRFGEHPFVKVWPANYYKREENHFPFEQVRSISPDSQTLQKELGDILTLENISELSKVRWGNIHFILWKGHFWRQFRFGKPLVPEIYPASTVEKLKKLTLPIVQSFFRNEIGTQFSEEFFNDILDRRDQVIKAYEQQHTAQNAPPEVLKV